MNIKKILIAPDSFKESLSAKEVVDAISIGVKTVFKNSKIIKIPIADGGEGSLSAISYASNRFKEYNCKVTSPLPEKKVNAKFLFDEKSKTIIIEMAQASGLTLVPENKRNPLWTTTYGTGEIIKYSLVLSPKKIIVFAGGSATCDGGIGALSALGVKFYNKKREILKFGGKSLLDIGDVDISQLDKRIKDIEFIVATDVVNPLVGKNGASYIFSPQKGANKQEVKILDKGLKNFARIIRDKINIDIENLSGAGAAGGLAGGLVAFCCAKIVSGFGIVAEIVKLEDKIKNVDLVITGEGKIDKQTLSGKVPISVAKLAEKYKIPVIAIVGTIGDNIDYSKYGITAVFSIITKPTTFAEIKKYSRELLIYKTLQIMNLLKI